MRGLWSRRTSDWEKSRARCKNRSVWLQNSRRPCESGDQRWILLLAELAHPEIDDAVAVAGHQDAIRLGGEFDERPAVIGLARYFSVDTEHLRETGIGRQEQAVFPEHEARGSPPFDLGFASPEVIAPTDLAAG